tara:strand:- start:770 stop:1039 length:270 start_codon:yes stop_codon:yes gene_type:complete
MYLVVKPLCSKYELTYTAGMGTRFFSKKGEILHSGVLPSSPDSWPGDYKRAVELLDTDIGGGPIHWYTENYSCEDDEGNAVSPDSQPIE